MQNVDVNQIAISVAEKVSSDLDVRIALISAGGVVIGAALAALGNIALHAVQNASKNKLDSQRKSLLKNILNEKERDWVKIETLSNVIGASKEETQRLLIDIGARGSKTGNGSWALLSRKPLPLMANDEEV